MTYCRAVNGALMYLLRAFYELQAMRKAKETELIDEFYVVEAQEELSAMLNFRRKSRKFHNTTFSELCIVE